MNPGSITELPESLKNQRVTSCVGACLDSHDEIATRMTKQIFLHTGAASATDSPAMPNDNHTDGVKRITVSMPDETYQALDRLVQQRGFDNRSQAVSEMIHQHAAQHLEKIGTEVMAGTLTVVYDESKSALLRDLSRIFREHIAEVISSQHVLLEDDHVLEVILMQGPARTLREIANKLVTCKGVKTAQLTLTPHLIPPLHAKRARD
jgi:CopG family nickel-responsive transcriptional regulator